ncbi:integral membrane protein [Pyrenophora tritici-repentis]|uniref:Rhodopsin domain-containing protein n=2 Tax=Pyrenophora tritici-repentis TaxID=45151 RepID=A0A2W1F8Y6_9PLEO|nr:uncharacterized protein PTRG_06367 [Pyrenophora tritici-repentis Pt-1C-BFP]KAA8613429.1 integral membrane protein [Pyrenophora tritici-repentis]EDU49287.1 integral membrane protein [Pyrenophora tritici-repentis Pt-1C-BFP]KAF7565406.1 hypothetical protein PtrM4_048400 [Pyrenophora tritici-repentis]KAG9380456.1 integral membrane protein [Pyrenophora tritici-repentis]KAI0581437.1 integral membrane protein [Pyrenophora tritici-repentis]
MTDKQPSPEFLAADISPVVLLTAFSMIVSCTIFVILRYYSRYLSGTAFSTEDVIIPFAWLAEVILCLSGIYMVEESGLGRHEDYLDSTEPGKIQKHYKALLLQEFLHPSAVALPKLAVVIIYLRILTNKYERFAAKVLTFLIIATWISYTVAPVFQCTPFAFNWKSDIPGGKCFNFQLFAQSSSVPNIATDVGVLLLPLRMVWRLKISIHRRIGLLLIFLTGSVGLISSILRAYVFVDVFSDVTAITDVTWTHVSLVDTTLIEPGIYLLSACAISFKPLLRMFVRALHFQNTTQTTPMKDTVGGRRSHTNPSLAHTKVAAYESVYDMGPARKVSEAGISRGLSDISEDAGQESKGNEKSEMTTKTLDKG